MIATSAKVLSGQIENADLERGITSA